MLPLVAGCHTGTLPNPNDPNVVGGLSPDNIQDQMSCISDMLQIRLARQQINDTEYNDLLEKAADSLLVNFNSDRVEPSKAWQTSKVMITAKHWADAKPVLEAAVEWAKINHNRDREINDTLRLARVEAEMGDVPQAIKTARTVFVLKPWEGAPILYATQLEIVPACRGKGHDVEVAKLLEDAIAIDLNVQVDATKTEGRDFLRYRPMHVADAWAGVVELYEDAKRPDLAEAARKKSTITPVQRGEVRA